MRKNIDRVIEIMLIALMSILVIDVLWQVISRYLLTSPSSFTDELAGYLLIWVGLLGAAYVTGKREHLAIDLMLRKAKPARKKALELFIQIVIIAFAIFVLITGGSWLMYTRFALEVKSAALELPLGYVYIILPFSGLLIAYYSLDNTIQTIKNKPE
jgi:TRAP-type C4-dicarboxylate transport system permease small subunit